MRRRFTGAVPTSPGDVMVAAMTDPIDLPPSAEADPTQDPATAVIAVVSTYPELMRALAVRRHELGMSQLEADAVSGLPDGYTGKIEAEVRRLGRLSLPSLLGALGVRLIVVRDPAYKPRGRKRCAAG